MPELNNQFPHWLESRFATHPGESPPWLSSAIQTSMQHAERQAKMPLELQQMALRNKATQLEIEHQGIQNDVLNEEMNAYAEDLPILRDYLDTVSKTPGGSLVTPAPMLRSRKGIESVLQHQKMDADTILGKTMMEDQIALTKEAAKVLDAGIDPTPAFNNGRWDRSALSDLSLKAVEDTNMRAANLRKASNSWHYDAQGNPITRAGNPPAAVATLEYRQKLKQQITDAEAFGEFDTADSLRDDLAALDRSHPDIRERARYQSIVSSIRGIERQLGDLTMKNKWPELEAQKARLLKQLESSSATELPTSSSTNKAFIWTPKGIVPK